MDDLNYLLKREQEELIRAQIAACSMARSEHHGRAQAYAMRIRNHQLPYRSTRADGSMTFNPSPFGAGGRLT